MENDEKSLDEDQDRVGDDVLQKIVNFKNAVTRHSLELRKAKNSHDIAQLELDDLIYRELSNRGLDVRAYTIDSSTGKIQKAERE